MPQTADGCCRMKYDNDGLSERNQACDMIAERMPSLKHNPDREKEFSYARSECVQWLLQMSAEELAGRMNGPHGAVWHAVADKLFQSSYRRGAIKCDKSTGLWHGSGDGYTSKRIQKIVTEKRERLSELKAKGMCTGGRFQVKFDRNAVKKIIQDSEKNYGPSAPKTGRAIAELIGCSKTHANRLIAELRKESLVVNQEPVYL
jgi:hypothetical protein